MELPEFEWTAFFVCLISESSQSEPVVAGGAGRHVVSERARPYPSPTSRHIITMKPAMQPHVANFPLPLFIENIIIKTTRTTSSAYPRRQVFAADKATFKAKSGTLPELCYPLDLCLCLKVLQYVCKIYNKDRYEMLSSYNTSH